MASIREIAHLAGVSPATVSRVLNEDQTMSVSDDTRQRIIEVANQLNYQKVKKTRQKNFKIQTRLSVGIIQVEPFHQKNEDPYFKAIHQGMEQEAANWKIRLEILDLEALSKDLSQLSHFGAIIVLGMLLPEVHEQIYHQNSNLIIIDDYFIDGQYDLVYPDFARKTVNVLDWLYQHGHRSISFIGGDNSLFDLSTQRKKMVTDVRTVAYKNWMKNHDLDKYINIKLTDWRIEGGLLKAEELIHEGNLPSAIVVASDPLSIGVYRAFQTHQIEIGKDISIFSFDDIEMAAYLTPSLSTVHIDSVEIGRVAIRLAKERIVDKRVTPLRVEVSSTLYIRESSQYQN